MSLPALAHPVELTPWSQQEVEGSGRFRGAGTCVFVRRVEGFCQDPSSYSFHSSRFGYSIFTGLPGISIPRLLYAPA